MVSPVKESIRRIAGQLMAFLLRQASRPYVLAPGGALVVAPHADDETLGCGGLLAAKVRAGHDVRVVFITDGSASHPGHPALDPAELVRRRRLEALAALGELGVPAGQAYFLEAGDGSLERLAPDASAALSQRISALIREFHPAEVLTTWRHDGSTEHAAAAQLAITALAAAGGGALLEFPIWAWWNPWRLRSRVTPRKINLRLPLGSLLPTKRRALACHHTQTEAIPPWREAVLPKAIARACCGPAEFFFSSNVRPDAAPNARG